MNLIKKAFVFGLIKFCLMQVDCFAIHQIELMSPDKMFYLLVKAEKGDLTYTLKKNNRNVIGVSNLGLEFEGMRSHFLEVISIRKDSANSKWEMPWGQQKEVIDSFNSTFIEMIDNYSNTKITVEFRLYNEGLAFRYILPDNDKTYKINNEKTEFNLGENQKCFVLTHPWGKFYKAEQPIGQINNASLPLLSKNKGGDYIFITEAALYNYSSLHLTAKDNQILIADLVGTVSFKTPFSTPWRVVMSEKSPSLFIERNYIIQNLNPPSKIKNMSWIKPGITLWEWRGRGAKEDNLDYNLNTETLLHFVDKAEEFKIPYFMIDAGWYGDERDSNSNPLISIPEINMPIVLKRAKDKNVGIWLYVNRIAFENYDIDKIFSKFKEWDVKGVKLGFLNDDSQWGVEFLQKVLEKCAEYEIMFDCHESVIPSGIERTWPHFLTREYCHSQLDGNYIANPLDHTVTPFLNGVVGPLDTNPGFFDIDSLVKRTYVRGELRSTVVRQMAMCLVYYSPLLCLPDIPEAYSRKQDLFDFIKSLPMTYDETKVLVGEPGEIVCIARRSGENWWIAAMGNENRQSIKISLSFLGEKRFKAISYEDEENTTWQQNREAYITKSHILSDKDTLQLQIAPGGGYCLKLIPE